MAVEATQPIGTRATHSATAAIRQASQVTGARFSYLLATAKVESNLNPNAAAKTSSAGGLFQFIDRTWLGTLKEAGPYLGYDRYADAITRTDDGRYIVNDPSMRREIMALRQDPTANALMAGVFTNSNAKQLTNNLGRAPTDGELYVAHFMGATGASRLIGMSESNPSGKAADAFPVAARANRSIFFDQSGRARSFAEVARNLTNRYDVAQARMRGIDAADATTAATPSTAFVPESPNVARAYQVAETASRIPALRNNPQAMAHYVTQAAAVQNPLPGESMFHNPYRSAQPRQAVSSTVANLWTNQNRTSQQEMARQMALELEGKTRPQAQRQANYSVQAPRYQTHPQYPVQQPQTVAQADTHGAPNNGALGLFQDSAPDVRSLFTHGVRG
ncbi:transglycosylase SLT domain-containing protein [Pseudorhodoplanes sinuspersici]|uniref:Uncharacterized protein n=1 Tax=Pseudorhodoplanes sinuspersici TaxID=1235591 RepID=A0A1W6ZV36_9HYPH|nr:transglycosylase SLT domain-containing protein [Pseudorhodoplanes sinuspersici]ARQ01267.1 hypothetical protein CAK95_20835 [Pseudorhodoplanes sinuspersici]RKE72944.1 transglycosylase-like protein with SLT domain [Pseudorhodoplanes sinuspersici]